MPSKLAANHAKKLTSDNKRSLMKHIFEQHFGIDIFAGSALDTFIFKQFRVGQRNN